ncbi:YlcI/YnfO family protein [Dorea longicatena]|uniref:YlcI/YnfO family protein n=1 Tax=Dorea longicatena TaxID=88431 RepID=UPI0036F37B9D
MAFQLKPNKKETENKTIRFPLHLVNEINSAIANENPEVSFSSFVIQACEYALKNMDVSSSK